MVATLDKASKYYNRRVNRFMRNRIARLKAIREQPAPQPPSTNPVDRWSTRAAAWAQVGTLVLLGVGYVLTVRPVFQYQLLQEQNAKLELQNAAAEASLRETRARQVAAAQELTTLTSTVERMNRDREALEKALRVERAREDAARRAAAASAGQAAAQVAALEETKERLLSNSIVAEQIAVTGDGDAKLTDSVWRSYADQYEKDFEAPRLLRRLPCLSQAAST